MKYEYLQKYIVALIVIMFLSIETANLAKPEWLFWVEDLVMLSLVGVIITKYIKGTDNFMLKIKREMGEPRFNTIMAILVIIFMMFVTYLILWLQYAADIIG